MTAHVLDRPAYSTLTGRQSHLAVHHGGALRMHPDFGLFAGLSHARTWQAKGKN